MTVRIRLGDRTYLVEAPEGSRPFPMSNGRPALAVPWRGPAEVMLWLPLRRVVAAARRGRYGLSLRSEAAAPSGQAVGPEDGGPLRPDPTPPMIAL